MGVPAVPAGGRGDADGAGVVAMAPKVDKLLAEWFWTDRWDGSSAVGLPIAARGLYREMLTQWCRLGGRLPSNLSEVQSLVRVTDAEWADTWPAVRTFWLEIDGSLYPVDDIVRVGRAPNHEENTVSHRPHIPAHIRREVFEARGRLCLHCGSSEFIELDHIVPFSRGGPDTADNLQPLCRPCNRRKSNH